MSQQRDTWICHDSNAMVLLFDNGCKSYFTGKGGNPTVVG